MLNEDIILDKPDLRSRSKILQGADCRRTGGTLRRLKLEEERKHHYSYLIEYSFDEVHDELSNLVHLSLNKKKRWEAVQELEEHCNNNNDEDEYTNDRPAVVTTVNHFRKPTIRWTCEKIKNLYFKTPNAENTQNTTQSQPTHGIRKAQKLRMGRKGFVGATSIRPQEEPEKQPVKKPATVLYEVLLLPQAGAYPLNRHICHCHFCTVPRSNKGKKKEARRANNLELYN